MGRSIAIFLSFLFTWCLSAPASAETEQDYARLRSNMVSLQIKDRGIKNAAVLAAMEAVPRHKFVPREMQPYAYRDRPLPIGFGQTISQPYIVALMTELLDLDKNAKVLEVGTGSGYQAAVLAMIVQAVYSVEIVRPLHERSTETMDTLRYENVFTEYADGYHGWAAYGPYDAIVVTCASEFIPPPLIAQLKPGGRMCIPVGPPFKVQHLVLIKKGKDEKLTTRIIGSVRFVPLVRGEN